MHRAIDADILVLGAGLQGSCVALALAAAGHQPLVVDRASAPVTQASRTNEGKVHLGFVYALDASLTTQRLMVRGALAFAPLLDRWLGPQPWARWRTDGIHYAVMPGSLLEADELERRYAAMVAANDDIAAFVAETIRERPHYLGDQLTGIVHRSANAAGAPRIHGVPVESFRTDERAIDPDRLAEAVGAAVREHPSIALRLETHVHEAARRSEGFDVQVTGPDGTRGVLRAPIVVNCLWDERLPIDATVGIESPVASWTYRVKHQVVVRPRRHAAIEAVTMVQGPFGDVVPRPSGRVCLSWYPVCRTQRQSTKLTRVAPDAAALAGETIAAMSSMFPALEGAEPIEVRGGTIMAPGLGDIDDPESGLHTRTNAAVHEHDGWWSIDTSKLTLAPLLAHEAVEQIDAVARARSPRLSLPAY